MQASSICQIRIILSIALTLISATTYCQAFFDQQYSSLNKSFPEFSGWHGGLQVNSIVGQQWLGIDEAPQGAYISADGYVHKIRSGIGFSAYHQRFGSWRKEQIDISISPKLQLSKKITLMPSLTLSRGNYGFGNYSIWGPTSGGFLSQLTMSTGIGFVSNKFFGAVHARLPVGYDISNYLFFPNARYSALLGRSFQISKFILLPTVSLFDYEGYREFFGSFNAQYRWAYLGASFGTDSELSVAIGYEYMKRLRLSYSYSRYANRIAQGSSGSHELALRVWLFKDKAKRQFISNLPII
ncbi:MAG: type IX secretion system membrane protein PorP/SprF [Flavobacteriales bacterium]